MTKGMTNLKEGDPVSWKDKLSGIIMKGKVVDVKMLNGSSGFVKVVAENGDTHFATLAELTLLD